MEIFLGFVIIFILIDIEEKLKKIQKKENNKHLDLSEYLNRDVYIALDNENVTNCYLFTSIMKTIGKIIDYDETWLIFKYYDKNIKKSVTQYLRINDLKSINIIK